MALSHRHRPCRSSPGPSETVQTVRHEAVVVEHRLRSHGDRLRALARLADHAVACPGLAAAKQRRWRGAVGGAQFAAAAVAAPAPPPSAHRDSRREPRALARGLVRGGRRSRSARCARCCARSQRGVATRAGGSALQRPRLRRRQALVVGVSALWTCRSRARRGCRGAPATGWAPRGARAGRGRDRRPRPRRRPPRTRPRPARARARARARCGSSSRRTSREWRARSSRPTDRRHAHWRDAP